MSVEKTRGHVYLVGAGPGALDLVTLRARELVGQADVLIYDYLCNPEMLPWARPGAEIIYAGKSGTTHTLPQDEINALLVKHAGEGKTVVRLKGGDPYVFGRGGEEAQALARAGIPFEVVPGVTSAIAVPAYAGIPVTHRDFASTVTFVTGHEDPAKAASGIDWKSLAGLRGTKVFLMGVKRLREIAQRLIAEGADSGTPAALIRWGTTGRQESVEGTLATLADQVEQSKLMAPAIIVVGEVVKLRSELNWFEALPLFGRRIIVTRTRRQASELTRKLERLGADVLEIPTIRIVPRQLSAEQTGALGTFPAHYDWLVFTSPNAVACFFSHFVDGLRDIRALGGVKIAAVGPGTQTALEKFYLQINLKPEISTAADLLRKFSEMDVSKSRFCLPHGNLADRLLANSLRQRGAIVDEWTVYETRPETEDITGARARYLEEGAHGIAFASSSAVENWHALQLRPAADAPQPKAISIGPVTSATLRKLGYEIAAESPAPTLDSLVDTICKSSID
jgi:uroporphyrinogen III methyltransferase/synthase